MRVLAIDCATEACSVALFEGPELLANRHDVLGRGHAERLIPTIATLPDHGRADRILVSLGPGSFTGVRIGIAAARALGIAWNAQVLGYPTLALVAVSGPQPQPHGVTVCMNGGHGQWFVQNFCDFRAQDDARSLVPESAQAACRHPIILGNRAHELAQLMDGATKAFDVLPDASKVKLLDEGHLTDKLAPAYGRAPDAKLPV